MQTTALMADISALKDVHPVSAFRSNTLQVVYQEIYSILLN